MNDSQTGLCFCFPGCTFPLASFPQNHVQSPLFFYHMSRAVAHGILSNMLTPQLWWPLWSVDTFGYPLTTISLVCPASHKGSPTFLHAGRWFSQEKQNFFHGLLCFFISKVSPSLDSRSKGHSISATVIISTSIFLSPKFIPELCLKHINSYLVSAILIKKTCFFYSFLLSILGFSYVLNNTVIFNFFFQH